MLLCSNKFLLIGYLKFNGIFEGGNFRIVNYSYIDRVFNKKKG